MSWREKVTVGVANLWKLVKQIEYLLATPNMESIRELGIGSSYEFPCFVERSGFWLRRGVDVRRNDPIVWPRSATFGVFKLRDFVFDLTAQPTLRIR